MSTKKDENLFDFDDMSLFSRWKSQWDSDIRLTFGKPAAEIPEEKIFLDLFKTVYQEFVSKMTHNKKKNMSAKKFLLPPWRYALRSRLRYLPRP